MNSKKTFILSLGFSIYCFFISLYLFHLYTGGDQLYYTHFYKGLHRFSLLDGYLFYKGSLGASEPIYYILIYIFNTLISKTLLFSIINAIFGFIVSKRLLMIGMHPTLLILFSLNFYLLVLLIPAERLKVSLLLFLLSFSFKNNKLNLVSVFLAILTHFQTLILLIPKFNVEIKSQLKNIYTLKTGKVLSFLLIIFLLISIPYYFFFESISEKFIAYKSQSGLSEVLKPTIFLVLSLIYKKNDRFTVLIMHLPIIVLAYFIGNSRLVILSFGIFLYYGLQYKKGLNFATLISLVYFAIKGLIFISDVKIYGEGF
ncbi:hypothetical protein INR76_09940 [Marixanthomonas sp. SCSIO 43207]|uniref:hypothetical protein n=1 Tax=Marixanthomonas sp. SCSIO 43207 TaxID=2779360 RepID=UPI001CA9FA76|nr:hypothetical protein [Marixanthomonas sp. SCSIO 43207]UAB80435.1 hypothetical protein INR76_09940 [Marixanthomonas sp. SCSIO 43207]